MRALSKYLSRGLLFIATLCCAIAYAATPFDAAFDETMARYDLPGLAVGVIENGKVVYARTAGERVAGSGAKITPQTLFKIASNSKAMTASVLARLVDAGKLRWDDPVIKYLPRFRLFDSWVSAHIEVRDLLVHNSGLPEGGGDLMLWPEPNRFTRADILAGLGHIKPAYGFRAGYAYDNLLYVVAGEVAAAAGGASYEELVRREVFVPLGLGCRVGEWRSADAPDVAQPHRREDGRNVVTSADPAIVPAITSAAAGGIRCSLEDMLVWARNWLAPNAAQLAWLSHQQRQAMWTARTPMPISARRRAWDHTHYLAYAFGFRLADVDGEWTVSHTGTLSGMYSAMMLLPDRRSGFVILINGEAGEARTVLTEVLLKHFTAPDDGRTIADYATDLAREASEPDRRVAPDTSNREPATIAQMQPRLGIWRDPWFGEISLCERDGVVRFVSAKSPLLSGTVMRVDARHLVDWDAVSVDAEAWLDFHDATATRPARLAMAKVDPEADFSYDYEDLSFTRIRDCDESSAVVPANAEIQLSSARTPAEAGLIDIATLVPDIALEMRYAGTDNFVGERIDGYDAARCLLLDPAARALARVERELRKQHLRLKLFDCYRPARAVAHFVRWAADLNDHRTKARYYPNLDKRDLLGGYIAPVSGHSRGATVDLTLLRCDVTTDCKPLDMGTDFDFFDVRAHTDAPGISALQRENRQRLREAMRREGFRNYPMEWWHYTLTPEPNPNVIFDVPLR